MDGIFFALFWLPHTSKYLQPPNTSQKMVKCTRLLVRYWLSQAPFWCTNGGSGSACHGPSPQWGEPLHPHGCGGGGRSWMVEKCHHRWHPRYYCYWENRDESFRPDGDRFVVPKKNDKKWRYDGEIYGNMVNLKDQTWHQFRFGIHEFMYMYTGLRGWW